MEKSDADADGGCICRICQESEPVLSLISDVCCCKGSMRMVHKDCLMHWIQFQASRGVFSFSKPVCEICKSRLSIQMRMKPAREWRVPRFSRNERVRIYVFLLSYILASFDIGYSLRLLMRQRGARWKLLFYGLFCFVSSVGWIIVFVQHTRFLLTMFAKFLNHNRELAIEHQPTTADSSLTR